MTSDTQRARTQQSDGAGQPRLPSRLSSMSLQASFTSLNRILAQIIAEQPLLLFLAFDNAQPAIVLVV